MSTNASADFLKRVLKDVMAQILADPDGRPAMIALDAADAIRLLDFYTAANDHPDAGAPPHPAARHGITSRRSRYKPRQQVVATTLLLPATNHATPLAAVKAAAEADVPRAPSDAEQVRQLIDRGHKILEDAREQRIISSASLAWSRAALARAQEQVRIAKTQPAEAEP